MPVESAKVRIDIPPQLLIASAPPAIGRSYIGACAELKAGWVPRRRYRARAKSRRSRSGRWRPQPLKQIDERSQIDVPARHDADDLAGAGPSSERGRDRRRAGALGHDPRALDEQPHRARPLRRATTRARRRSSTLTRGHISGSTPRPPIPSTKLAVRSTITGACAANAAVSGVAVRDLAAVNLALRRQRANRRGDAGRPVRRRRTAPARRRRRADPRRSPARSCRCRPSRRDRRRDE